VKQFDVCANPDAATRSEIPFIVVLQSDHVLGLGSVVVAPVRRFGDQRAMSRLGVGFSMRDEEWVINIHELATITRSRLRSEAENLEVIRDRIIRALDFLFTGI
jgi:toxin CcdB